ncbi:MAG: hypothetical protein ACJ8AH_12980 [Stellaceae bacterium]
METQLRVALAQYPSGREPAAILAEAKAAAADIVVFPEMYSNGYARFDPEDPAARARWCADAHRLDGDFVGKFRGAREPIGYMLSPPFSKRPNRSRSMRPC